LGLFKMRDIELENKLKGINTQDTNGMPLELKKDIELLSAEIINTMQKIPPPENKLMTPEGYKQKIKQEVKEKLQMREVGKSLSHALFMIQKEGRRYLDMEGFTKVIDDIENAFDHLMKLDPQVITETSIKELTAISDETINNVEIMAIQKHKENENTSSGHLFLLLTILDPNNFSYWIRMGIIHQESKNFTEALKFYGRAVDLNSTNIPNHLFMAECYLETKDTINAQQEYELLKTLIDLQDIDVKWKEHFMLLESMILKMK
jgi:tetratricopeptide (TPR) repeat protein